MNLLLLISGNAEAIITKLGDDLTSFVIIKIDEKDLSKRKFIINLMKNQKYEKIVFGTLDLEFQRFNFFIGLYLFLSGYSNGILADNFGNIKRYSLLRFLFIEIPMFILELFLSSLIIVYNYIKFPIIKRLWKSRS